MSSPSAAHFSVRRLPRTALAPRQHRFQSHSILGSKVASRCKLEEYLSDAAAWRVRIAANSRQRQLFDDVIGTSVPEEQGQSKSQKIASSKAKHKGKDEIDLLFDAAGTESRPQVDGSSKRATQALGSNSVPIPSNCDPSVAAVLNALAGGAKKRKHK